MVFREVGGSEGVSWERPAAWEHSDRTLVPCRHSRYLCSRLYRILWPDSFFIQIYVLALKDLFLSFSLGLLRNGI